MIECRTLFWLQRGLLLGVCLFAFARGLPAQAVENLHVQSWSTEQGLPQDSVHQIVQDHEGFLWVATERGLARFDGTSFRVFTHQTESAFTSDDICCVAVGGGQDVWAGTADGLLRFHERSFVRYSEKEGLPSAAIRGLAAEEDGSLLVLTTAGLVRWKEGRIGTVAGAPADVDGIAPGGDGSVWLFAAGRVLRLKGGILSAGPGAGVGMVPLQGGRLGPGGVLWTFSATAVQRGARRWQAGRDLPGRRIQSFFVDRAGAAWVGTNDGLAVLGKDAAAVVVVPALRGDSVLATFEDHEGNLWVGTESSGLHLLRTLAFRGEPATTNKAITAVAQDGRGAIWLGTRQDGLLRSQHGMLGAPVRAESLTSPVILSLAAGTAGSLWAGTPDGLNHIGAHGAVTRWTSAEGLPDDYIQALASDARGCVWAGTRRGLAHVCRPRVDTLTRAEGLAGDLVGALLLARSGDLWIATSGGLSRRAPGGRIDRIAGLGHPGIVSAMAEDARGTLWVATREDGLFRLSAGLVRPDRASAFRADILGMVADDKGSLWLRRARGIDRVALADLDRCADGLAACEPHVSHFGVADGLPSEEASTAGSPALALLADGQLWVATRRGIGVADPAHLPRSSVPPGIAIESFAIDGVPHSLARDPISLPYGGRHFTIEYTGLSFAAPSEVRYRFLLEGFDTAWTEAGARRTATYTNLPPRSFTFRVQARSKDGVWNEASAALTFRIVPPIYRRWWFLALATLVLAALAVGLYLLRLQRLRTQFDAVLQERNRMAREIHDTLAQDFVGVTLQLDLIGQMLGMKKLDAAVQQVQQARKLVTEGLAEARQSIWELRANSATDSLPTRLGRIVERYTGDKPVLHTKIGGAFRPLDHRLETEVLRVAQEALSNVQRHSHAEHASVELHYGRDTLVLTIEDNGRGFVVEDALRSRERFGLSGLGERASLLGGSLTIDSEPGKGTRITLCTKTLERKDGRL